VGPRASAPPPPPPAGYGGAAQRAFHGGFTRAAAQNDDDSAAMHGEGEMDASAELVFSEFLEGVAGVLQAAGPVRAARVAHRRIPEGARRNHEAAGHEEVVSQAAA
jgi:hypothetical protein